MKTQPEYRATGLVPVVGSFVANGDTAAFKPLAGRDFNVVVGEPAEALGATVTLVRRFSDAELFKPVTWPDGTVVSWTDGVNTSWSDPEAGVQYALRCAAFTAEIDYRLSQ